jgi:hypothetical protein
LAVVAALALAVALAVAAIMAKMLALAVAAAASVPEAAAVAAAGAVAAMAAVALASYMAVAAASVLVWAMVLWMWPSCAALLWFLCVDMVEWKAVVLSIMSWPWEVKISDAWRPGVDVVLTNHNLWRTRNLYEQMANTPNAGICETRGSAVLFFVFCSFSNRIFGSMCI